MFLNHSGRRKTVPFFFIILVQMCYTQNELIFFFFAQMGTSRLHGLKLFGSAVWYVVFYFKTEI